mmetsp:Transcript_177/g.593  ORF Transcript_177/g.593 Transcript_177/m.593 type:complete len:99 (-) Transcript_177:542-838(-)
MRLKGMMLWVCEQSLFDRIPAERHESDSTTAIVIIMTIHMAQSSRWEICAKQQTGLTHRFSYAAHLRIIFCKQGVPRPVGLRLLVVFENKLTCLLEVP